jgi:hypothetical protein
MELVLHVIQVLLCYQMDFANNVLMAAVNAILIHYINAWVDA